MFGKKPQTYQDIVLMKICLQLQTCIPAIDEETLEKIYTSMVNHPSSKISIADGVIHFDEAFGEADIDIIGPHMASPIFIQHNTLHLLPNPTVSSSDSGSSSYDDRDNSSLWGGGFFSGGTSGNNNNNNNNA